VTNTRFWPKAPVREHRVNDRSRGIAVNGGVIATGSKGSMPISDH